MKEDRSKLRAFKIFTNNSVCSTDLYVVIANDYAEAEDIYWNELNGYYEIIRIEEIEATKEVGYRTEDKATQIKKFEILYTMYLNSNQAKDGMPFNEYAVKNWDNVDMNYFETIG